MSATFRERRGASHRHRDRPPSHRTVARSTTARSIRALLFLLACAWLPDLGGIAVARAQSAAPPSAVPIGLCSILTLDEVSRRLGELVAIVEETPDTCVFAAAPDRGSLTGLAVSRERADPLAAEPLIDQVRATFPSAVDVEIGGLPALATETETLTTGWSQAQLVLFPEPTTMLFLAVVVPVGTDAAGVVLGLAEVASPRLGAPPADA